MDDGYCDKHTIYLCTDCYSIEEVELLIKVLYSNFALDAPPSKGGGGGKARDVRRIRSIDIDLKT